VYHIYNWLQTSVYHRISSLFSGICPFVFNVCSCHRGWMSTFSYIHGNIQPQETKGQIPSWVRTVSSIHSDINNHRKHGDKSVQRRWHSVIDVCLQSNYNILTCNLLHFCNHFYTVVTFAFRRVRKIAKSDYSLRHIHPSVRMEHLASHWTDFHEIWYLSICRKLLRSFRLR